jgi:hypothetical protein
MYNVSPSIALPLTRTSEFGHSTIKEKVRPQQEARFEFQQTLPNWPQAPDELVPSLLFI